MRGVIRTVPERLAELAATTPNAPAIVAAGRPALTFEQLLATVRRTAAVLAGYGFAPGDRIATVLPDGPETLAVLLGLMSGATGVPLNPSYTRAELASYLERLRVKAVLVEAGTASPAGPLAAEMELKLLEMAPDADGPVASFRILGGDETAEPRLAGPDDELFVLHTSGTTGRPKVVPITHASECFAVERVITRLALRPTDRYLNTMPLHHRHGLGASVTALLSGGSVIAPCDFSAPLFFALFDRLRPTWYSATPTIHRAVLAQMPDSRDVDVRRQLRFIRTASAPMPARLRTALEAAFAAPVIDGFGMTECPWAVQNGVPPASGKGGSQGYPCASEIAILDESGSPVPAGEVGEVVVRGPNVFAGYDGDVEANRLAFREGWFRTGDLGRLDADGFLWLTGRLTEVINRGGSKIAPGEVDEALLACPSVVEAATFPVPDDRLGQDVAAAIVPLPGATIDPADLRRQLFLRLAHHKVPRQILVVDALPRNATGKVLRAEVAARFGGRLTTGPAEPTRHVAPRSVVEDTVASIWAEALDRRSVGVEDDFLSLGGDSLRAGQIVRAIRSATGLDAGLAALFEAGTVAGLAAALVASAGSAEAVEAAISIRRRIAALEPAAVRRLLAASNRRSTRPGSFG